MNLKTVLVVLDPLVGVCLIAAGVTARARRGTSNVGLHMTLAGTAWLAGTLVATLAFVHRGPLVHLHLSYPGGRLRRRLAVAVTVAVYAVSVLEGYVGVPWLTLVLSVAVVAVAVETFAQSTGAARKAALPALAAALAFAGALGFSSLNRIYGWGLDGPVAVGYDVVIVVAVAVLLADLLNGRWVDATVTDLVLDLGSRAGVTGLQRQLRRALGDPTLELGIRVPGRDGFVDESGHPVSVDGSAADRTVTRLDGAAGPVAVLVHDPAAIDDPALLAAVSAAARLAVANTGMQADIEVRAAEQVATRRRLVEASDVERRRLVEAIQGGAESRLRSADAALAQIGRPGLGAQDPLVGRVRDELNAAVDELRAFAQGIRPTALAVGGLAAAVPELASRAGPPVTVDISVGRLPAAEEAAVYFVCSEGLANAAKHARASRSWVRIHEVAGVVTAEIGDDGIGGADLSGSGIQGLIDRVQAVGGSLNVADRVPHGTRLMLVLPRPPDSLGTTDGDAR